MTEATWMRQFVQTHPAYKSDRYGYVFNFFVISAKLLSYSSWIFVNSVITQEIAYDLLMTCKNIGEGTTACPDILGDVVIDR